MAADFLRTTVIISLLAATVRIATPILLAALGELVTERAGVLNLGVEGCMLMGAFLGFLAANKAGSLTLGVLAALAGGGLMAFLMAFLAASLKVDQTLAGLAINLLASGMSFYAYRVIYPRLAAQGDVTIPQIKTMNTLAIPYLSRIPVLGEVLFSQQLLSYLALFLVPVIGFFLYRTKYGLELRCLGENPRAIDTRGLSVTRRQYLAVVFGGMMAGLGGSFLTLASAGLFVRDITAGRGWLAIIVVIASNWRPGRILVASLILSALEAFQLQAQGIGVALPHQVLLASPYVFAIVALVLTRTRSEAPHALGVPYMRE